MRLLIIALCCLPFLYSCETTTPEPPTSNNVVIGPQPKFEYKANGALINQDAVYDPRVGYIISPAITQDQDGNYSIISYYGYAEGYGQGGKILNYLQFLFPRNITITQTSYLLPGAGFSDSKIGGLSYFSANVTITITRVSNGYADGTFSGTISKTNPASTVSITEGKFSNVPIINY